MPVPRFWQFEDATVDFGDLSAPREDLTRVLLVEFALVYGNDHFIVPIDLDVGSLATVSRLVVTDTFGVDVEIPPVAEADAASRRPGTFRLFELGTGAVRSPLFLLAPTLASSLNGDPIEEVRLFRDEGANLAWAVEAIAAASDGLPAERAAPPAVAAQPSNTPGEAAWRYRLRTPVAAFWRPLVPVADQAGVNHFEMAQLSPLDGTAPPPPDGRILAELADQAIPEEEISRVASRVTRAWQYARWIDGRQHAWVGRRRAPVSPGEDSGLRFDVLE